MGLSFEGASLLGTTVFNKTSYEHCGPPSHFYFLMLVYKEKEKLLQSFFEVVYYDQTNKTLHIECGGKIHFSSFLSIGNSNHPFFWFLGGDTFHRKESGYPLRNFAPCPDRAFKLEIKVMAYFF